MMDLLLATSGGESQSASGGYVDDVFSAYTYTGNGSTQTINNGIDLAGKGGLVWLKNRSRSAISHALIDSARTANGVAQRYLSSNTTAADQAYGSSSDFYLANGFTMPWVDSLNSNYTGDSYVSWTFRKAAKFFDVVTYTGDGTSNRQIAHGLGVQAGFVTVKATSTTGDWNSYHRSATGDLKLNLTDAQTASRAIITAADASTFTVSGAANTSGVTYVAYLFAHDHSAEGIIQCGSFTTDGSGNATVNLGWEPQYLMVKRTNTAQDWFVLDSTRGFSVSGTNNGYLSPNQSSAESLYYGLSPTATGFTNGIANLGASQTYIYLAIRRSNKPPTSGTQVYNAIARTGTGAAATVTGVGFAPDLVHSQDRAQQLAGSAFYDRLRSGSAQLLTTRTDAEFNDATQIKSFNMDGYTASIDTVPYPAINSPSVTYINHFFRRAPWFFDVVCYTGTGSATTVAHNLGAVPELMIVKSRSGDAQPWAVFHTDIGATKYLLLNSTAFPSTSSAIWNDTAPSSTTFAVGGGAVVNLPVGRNYIAYLFASLPGISKVGSYTGNGSSQTINCGFATGARLILIKRTDATGDWYVWDSVRGIIAANDPHLSLNTTAAEVTTDDSVDPDASGFIVNQNTATNINVNGGSYIFLAIA